MVVLLQLGLLKWRKLRVSVELVHPQIVRAFCGGWRIHQRGCLELEKEKSIFVCVHFCFLDYSTQLSCKFLHQYIHSYFYFFPFSYLWVCTIKNFVLSWFWKSIKSLHGWLLVIWSTTEHIGPKHII